MVTENEEATEVEVAEVAESVAEEAEVTYLSTNAPKLTFYGTDNCQYQFLQGMLKLDAAKAKMLDAMVKDPASGLARYITKVNREEAEEMARKHIAATKAAAVSGGFNSMHVSAAKSQALLEVRDHELQRMGATPEQADQLTKELANSENLVLTETAPKAPPKPMFPQSNNDAAASAFANALSDNAKAE